MAEPTLAEIIRVAIDSRLLDLWTALPGKVEKYDAANQLADVKPAIKRALSKDDGATAHEELPVIPAVPVVFPRGSGDSFSVTWPLAAGDHVLLVFSASAVAMWRESGQLSEPGDLRRHSLSHAFAIPGIGPKADTLAQEANVLVVDAPMTKVGPAAAEFVALATQVLNRLSAIVTTYNTHTHPETGVTTGVPNQPMATPASVAATKLKAE